MTFSFCIGAYRLPEFIDLGICQIRECFGDVPILVCDDKSDQSSRIHDICREQGVTLLESRSKRGHFAGDLNALVNALTFAEAHECDIAVKLSQRFIFRLPACKAALEEAYANPEIKMALPGRMSINTIRKGGSGGFFAMPVLTDMISFRRGTIQPDELIQMYRKKCHEEGKLPWGNWIEAMAHDLSVNRFKDNCYKIEALTNHVQGQEPIYLRRNQNTVDEYRLLAKKHGICGEWSLHEWHSLERGTYYPIALSI